MTLRTRLAVGTAAIILGLLLVSAASLWGLYGLRREHGLAVRGYESLRNLFEAASRVSTARSLLELGDTERLAAARELAEAEAKLRLAFDTGSEPARALLSYVSAAHNALIQPTGADRVADGLEAINASLSQVAAWAAATRVEITHSEQAAEDQLRLTTTVMAILAGLIVVATALIGVRQYRSVIDPLRRLAGTTRRIATRELSHRADPTNTDTEFRELANDFNRMADELEALYNSLERQIADKSRELVRSERLASVGYLAAGVAHEINNPLGIIAAHAELLITRLERQSHAPPHPSTPPDPQTLAAVKVMCEETFRCKQIIERVLDLARPADEAIVPVELPAITRQVVELVSALPQAKGRSIRVEVSELTEPAKVDARAGEIKQVLINLVLNALAADARNVTLAIQRNADSIEICIADDGRGMTPDVIERVFEPFFTVSRVSLDGESSASPHMSLPRAGTGLGLSISHAIVRNHGGTLRATSAGPGKGSEFALVLPRTRIGIAGGIAENERR